MTQADPESLRRLVERIVRDEPGTAAELIARLHGELEQFVRSNRSMNGVRGKPGFEDDVRNACVAIETKIAKREKLLLYLLWQDDPDNLQRDFMDWLRIVAKNTIRDYMRRQLGPRSEDPDVPSPKQLLERFATASGLSQIGERPGYTARDLALRLLEFAEKALSSEQLETLKRHLNDEPFEAIDAALGWAPDSAVKHWRSAVEKLRRYFR